MNTLDLQRVTRDNWRFTPAPGAENEGLVTAWQNFPSDVGSTHAAQLATLVANLDAGTRPLTSGREARRTLELLSAIYKSAFTGEIVRAGSILPGDRFYHAVNGGGPQS
jgi:predicted dehydrogenase